jgi:hypothetical protein
MQEKFETAPDYGHKTHLLKMTCVKKNFTIVNIRIFNDKYYTFDKREEYRILKFWPVSGTIEPQFLWKRNLRCKTLKTSYRMTDSAQLK